MTWKNYVKWLAYVDIEIFFSTNFSKETTLQEQLNSNMHYIAAESTKYARET